MGLLSIFKRQADAATSAPKNARGAANSAAESSDAVLRARTRARQRLIGAAVLLLIGIIGFPLVFETQPRPIPVNIPIEAPGKDGAPPLAMPAARTPAAAGTATPASAVVAAAESTASPSAASPASSVPPAPPEAKPAATAKPAERVITETSEDAGREVVLPPAAPAPAKPAAVKPAPPAAKPAAEPAAQDAARAEALLEGKKPAPPAPAEKPEKDAGRFVVQLGAYSDNASAHAVRVKAEKLGIKTFAQVVTTATGKRYRVRIGPFASRGEADKALAKAKSAGLSAAVMTL